MNDSIRDKIREIEISLRQFSGQDDALHTGNSGTSIFFAHHSRIFQSEESQEAFNAKLEEIISRFGTNYALPTFCGGFTGVCWTMAYLNKSEFVEFDSAAFFSEIEDMITRFSLACLKNKLFDFMHEGLGAALYLLEPGSAGSDREDLRKMVVQLHENMGQEKVWMLYQTKEGKVEEELNLGLAHGIPSVVAILSYCHQAGIEQDLCREMIELGVRFLLASQGSEEGLSLYPTHIREGKWIGPSRLGWCYGDLGVASAIWQAGKELKREDWKEEALKIMIHCSKRRNLDENSVADASLCHGTAGIAHIFNRFYKETGLREMDEARTYWVEQTLKMSRWEDGPAGFKSWDSGKGWVNEYSLLEGIAGIGLALLGFMTEDIRELNWDRCLLLS